MTRSVGCWLVLLPFLLIAGACAPAVLVRPAPSLERVGVAAILVAAEAARAGALASADLGPGLLRAPLFSKSVLEVPPGPG